MNALPVLIIKSPVPGLLLVNGQAACEVDGVASLPVSATGDVFLLFTPYGDYLPIAMRLSFSGGDIMMRDFNHPVVAWPDNITEISLEPRPIGDALPGRIADVLHSEGAVYSLIRREGCTLLIEDEQSDEELFRLNIPGAKTGSLRELDISGENVAGALIEEEEGERLLLFSYQGERLMLLCDVSGDSIRFEGDGGVIRSVKSLGDVAGHDEMRLLERRRDGGFETVSHDFTAASQTDEIPRNARDLALALTQALALGLYDEARAYISPDYLSRVGFDEMRMFLGAFSTVEDARYSPVMRESTSLALMTYTANNAKVARVYAFESDGRGISSIKRYDAKASEGRA